MKQDETGKSGSNRRNQEEIGCERMEQHGTALNFMKQDETG